MSDLARRRDFAHASASILATVPPTFRATGTAVPPAGSGIRSVTRPGIGQHRITLEQGVDVAATTISWGPRAAVPGFMLRFSFVSTTVIQVDFTALPGEAGTEGDYDVTVQRTAP